MGLADISSLGELRPVEMLDLENYVDTREAPPLPKAGIYPAQAPESFPSTAFSRTKGGSLSAEVNPIINADGQTIKTRFIKVSAKTFQRSGKTVSQLGDYLRAFGIKKVLRDEQEQADAVAETANRFYEVAVDWRAYNKATGYQLEGMKNFPSDGNGGHQSWCEDPNARDEQGRPVRLRAQLYVTRFIAANND